MRIDQQLVVALLEQVGILGIELQHPWQKDVLHIILNAGLPSHGRPLPKLALAIPSLQSHRAESCHHGINTAACHPSPYSGNLRLGIGARYGINLPS